jgi:hypothetical protein
VHDGDAYAAVVGEVLDPRYSTYPVLAILRSNAYLILTADRYRGPITVGPEAVRGEVPFAE